MKQTLKFQKVSIFRRICSILFDAIVCISIFFILQAFVVQPIFNSTTDYYQKYEKYCDVMEDTNLYIYYEEVQGVSVISTNYDKHLTDFYNSEYATKLGYNSETYYKIKWENCDRYPDIKDKTPIFIYTDEGNEEKFIENVYVLDSNGNLTTTIDENKQIAVDNFYYELVNKLINELQNIEEIKELTSIITAYTMLFFIVALIPAVLITYLVMPMIFKDGTTLGKKMLQMRVIDSKTGKNAKKFQLFFRFTFFALVQVVLGIGTYGIIPLISIAMIFINKNRQTIHDLTSSTLVVCNTYGEKQEVKESEIIEIVIDDGKDDEERGEYGQEK